MAEMITYLRILVPTAGPVPARDRADYILKIAQRLHGELEVLHIIDKSLEDPTKKEEGQQALDIFQYAGERFGIKVRTHLEEGELIPTLVSFANEHQIDLIVMGASEDGQIVAEWVVSDLKEKSTVPVVIVPYGFSQLLDQGL
jgi:nucleotide-binding universal stress UspA family protein